MKRRGIRVNFFRFLWKAKAIKELIIVIVECTNYIIAIVEDEKLKMFGTKISSLIKEITGKDIKEIKF